MKRSLVFACMSLALSVPTLAKKNHHKFSLKKIFNSLSQEDEKQDLYKQLKGDEHKKARRYIDEVKKKEFVTTSAIKGNLVKHLPLALILHLWLHA